MRQLGNITPQGGEKLQYRFWFPCIEGIEPSLVVTPFSSEKGGGDVSLQILDADGKLANEGQACFEDTSGQEERSWWGEIPIAPLCEGLKLESGFRHGTLVMTAGLPVNAHLQVRGDSYQSILIPPGEVTSSSPRFFPVPLQRRVTTLIALVNPLDVSVTARLRVAFGNRVLESFRKVPPRGSRILHPAQEFPETAELQGTVVYYRVSVKGEEEKCLVQLFQEKLSGGKNEAPVRSTYSFGA